MTTAGGYTVCELDGTVVHTTADSEDATRVLALEPSRRCVVRDGAVLRWGARVTPGERRSAEVFLRRARLLTVLPSTSPDETRAQIAHRDSKPENVTPAPPAEEETMPNCRTEGCTHPATASRPNTPPSQQGFCRKCWDRIRHRKSRQETAAAPSIAKTCSAPDCSNEVESTSKRVDVASLCKMHGMRLWARESAERKKGMESPQASSRTRAAASPSLPTQPPKARHTVQRDPKPSGSAGLLAHARRCIAVVARLGGVDEVEQFAQELGR